MKKGMGVLIIVFLTGMILGTMQPAMLFAGETGGGNIWDPFIDEGPYPLLRLVGPLSIYYELAYDEGGFPIMCDGDQFAYMYYTVRLNREFQWWQPTLYTYQGANGSCLNNWQEQGTIIKEFLGTVVNEIFPSSTVPTLWKLKSIKKAGYNDDGISRAFVADIEIAVRPGR